MDENELEVIATIPDSKIDAVTDSLFTCGVQCRDWHIRMLPTRMGRGIAQYRIRSMYPETMKEALLHNGVSYREA